MRDSADPLAGCATHGTAVVDPAINASFPGAPIAAWTDRTFRDLKSESRQTPMDLHLRRRLWWLSSITLVLCAAAMASTRVLGGSALVQRVFFTGMIATVAAGLWMGWMARTRRMTVTTTTIAWFIVTMGGCSTILYFGLFSPPGLMVAVFIVFFVGVRDERRVVIMVYLLFAVFHVALVGVLAGGGPSELGVLPFADSELAKLAATELLIQLVLLVTLIAACAIRRSMVSTVRDLEDRAREIGHHELLLDDAKRAFEASLRAVGGGRFSHQILGSYRLGRLLGEGAMGEVYDAIDTRTGTAAAVKLLRRGVMENRRIVQRFLTEARILTSLRSDHVARVLETAEAGSSLPYIAMERLHGRNLRKLLRARRDGRMSLTEADDLLRQIAQGIDAAHRAGIIHRDLKPSNLFREDSGTWKILDFGVSKVIGEHTAEHSIVGTPSFMSPEQLKGGTIDGRADIFALGAIMYYAITGRLAFTGETLAAIAFQVTHHAPLRPSELIAGVPPGIDEAVMTALAKDCRKRFATATAFSEAFHGAIELRLPDPDRDRAQTQPAIPCDVRSTDLGSESAEAGNAAREGASLGSMDAEALGAAPLCTMVLRGEPWPAHRQLAEPPPGEPQNDELEIGG